MPQWPLDIAELNMLSYRFYEQFARNLLSWKHSGFSIDDSVKCFNTSSQANLAEYISRPPISLEKLRYDPVLCQNSAGFSYVSSTKAFSCPGRLVCRKSDSDAQDTHSRTKFSKM